MKTVWIIHPLTQAARTWMENHVQAKSWQRIGDAYAIEQRFIGDITSAMMEAGLWPTKDFRVS